LPDLADPARATGFLGRVERAGNRLPDPALIFVGLIFTVIACRVIGAALGWNAINPVSGKTIAAESLLRSANLARLFIEMPRTLASFAPLG